MLTKDEYEQMGCIPRVEESETGRLAIFRDIHLGTEGRYINQGELANHEKLFNIAISNLEGLIRAEDIKFAEIVEKTGVLKLTEPIHPGIGRSLILVPRVKAEIEKLFGNEYLVVISNRGHLYIADKSKKHEELFEVFSKIEKKYLENSLSVYKFEKGRFTKVATARR
ncbi:MAG: hypothetical protein COA82_08225 [Alkaliphilus sp.]|nr:MAG: hypothetical protein COA82_08225 [Alkaliphilus sp.]